MICNISSITGLLHRHYDHHYDHDYDHHYNHHYDHHYDHHHHHHQHLSWQLPVNIIPRTTIGLGINKKTIGLLLL